jgi:hypothetical protein
VSGNFSKVETFLTQLQTSSYNHIWRNGTKKQYTTYLRQWEK